MPSTDPQRWARVRPEHARHAPSLQPGNWYRVIEENREAMRSEPRGGYVWVLIEGRLLHVRTAFLEIRNNRPDESDQPTSA
jgi:hypothetical protein